MKCAKCDSTATHYMNIVVETPERETDYIDGYACDYHAEPQIPVGFSVLESQITELPKGAPMKRLITIEIDLTDEQLGKIVPSVGVWVEITSNLDTVQNQAAIVKVKDIKR